MLSKRSIDLTYDDNEALDHGAVTADVPASKLRPAVAVAVILALSVGLWALLGTVLFTLIT